MKTKHPWTLGLSNESVSDTKILDNARMSPSNIFTEGRKGLLNPPEDLPQSVLQIMIPEDVQLDLTIILVRTEIEDHQDIH